MFDMNKSFLSIVFPRSRRASSCRSKLSLQKRRQGASAVEFALVSPFIFLIIGVLMQFSGLAMSQNVLTNAAREGGRFASLPTTVSTEDVVSRVESRLEAGGVNPELATINLSPSNIEEIERGDQIIVTVTVPVSDLAWLKVIPLQDAILSSAISYERE
jgi:hypothetical protein